MWLSQQLLHSTFSVFITDNDLLVSPTMTTIQPSNNSELQLYRVLQRANLLKYFETFISQGGDDVQQLCEAGEDEFLEIMVLVGMASKPLHVRRLQKALQEWVANPAAFEVKKKCPSHIMSNGSKSSVTVTAGHPLVPPDDGDDSSCPPASSPLLASTPGRAQGKRTSSSPLLASTPHRAQGTSPSPQLASNPHRAQGKDTSSSPQLASTPGRAQGHDTSSSDGSNFDDPNSRDSQLGDFQDTTRDYLADQTNSGIMFKPDPRLSGHQVIAIATAASRLATDLPVLEPKSAPKKPISQDILTVMQMSADDPLRMSALRKYAAIYGRFDSRRKNDKPMNMHEISVNEAAAQLCSHCPALLTRREELFPLARQVVRESGYQYSKGHSRAADILLQSKIEMSDTVPSTLNTTTANHVTTLSDLETELDQVTQELTDITKEQNRIRSALRYLLESNDHDQMRKLTAEMDILNDRQTAMTKKRQKIKNAVAKCSKSVPENSMLPESCAQASPVCAQLSTNSTNKITHISSGSCYGYSNELLSGNPLNTLYLAALQNQKDSLFEEGLRIAKQYGMSDFAEELIGLKSTTEHVASKQDSVGSKQDSVGIKQDSVGSKQDSVGSKQDSGSMASPVDIPTMGSPPHSTASVPAIPYCAVVASSSTSLLLDYSVSGCRQYKDSLLLSSSLPSSPSLSSSSSQAAVSSVFGPVHASEGKSLSNVTSNLVSVSENCRHKHALTIRHSSQLFPCVAGEPANHHCVEDRCSDPPGMDSSRDSSPPTDDDCNVIEDSCTPQPAVTKKHGRMTEITTARTRRQKRTDTDYHSIIHAEKRLCSDNSRWSRNHANDHSRMLCPLSSTAARTSSASV